MHIDFFKLNKKYRLDIFEPPSSEADIKAMQQYFKGTEIPDDYILFISQMSEAEILVMNESYIRIWGASGCLEMNSSHKIQEYIPQSLAVGDDEGGKVIFYAEGKKGFGLYKVGFGDLEINNAEFVSSSLSALLLDGIGAEVFL